MSSEPTPTQQQPQPQQPQQLALDSAAAAAAAPSAQQFSSQDGVRKTRKFEVKPAKKPTSPDTVEQGTAAPQNAVEPAAGAPKDEKPSAKDDGADGKVQRKGRFTVIEKGQADEARETASEQSSVSSTPTASQVSVSAAAPPSTAAPAAATAPAPTATTTSGLSQLEIPASTKQQSLSPATSTANLQSTSSGNNLKQDLLQEQLQQIFAMNSMILQRLEHLSPSVTPSGSTPISRRAAEIAIESTSARRPESATNAASSRTSKDKNLERLRNYLNEMRSELEQAASQREDLETVMRTLKERNTSLERKLEEEKHKRQQLDKKLKAEQKKLAHLREQLELAAAQNPSIRVWLAQIDGSTAPEDGSHPQPHAQSQPQSQPQPQPIPQPIAQPHSHSQTMPQPLNQPMVHHAKFASTGHIAHPIPLQFGSQPGQPPMPIVTSVPQYATPYSAGPVATTANTASTNGQMTKPDGSQFIATTAMDSFSWPTADNAGLDMFNSTTRKDVPTPEPTAYSAPMADPWSNTPIPLTSMPTAHPVVGSAVAGATLQRMTSASDATAPLTSAPLPSAPLSHQNSIDAQWAMRAQRPSVPSIPQPQPFASS